MVVDVIALGKAIGARLLSSAGALLKGGFAKRSARNRAMKGEDLSSQGSLEHIVKAELVKLAASSDLPQELQNDFFRAWLLTENCIELFVEVLIAQAGGDPALAQRARDDLARRYEQTTGETRKLATGPLNLVVSNVYGQLTATEPARQVLYSALAVRSAALLHGLRHPDLCPFPTDADLEHLRTVSARLLEAGRATWKMPAFVAPLTLEAHEDNDKKEARPVTTVQLVEAIEEGDNLILFGDGGIGKTTFLLELASLCTRKAGRRAPLYVDAAIWARSGVGVLDYLASTAPAQALGVTSGNLAKFAESGSLVLLVNGWNEIPAERKSFCRETFNILTTTAPALAVAVTSRTAHDAASLRSPRRIIVRGLTWQGQSAVIRSELSEGGSADALLEVLARDTRLRHAARSPLILRGLIAQAQTGAKVSSNVYDLLGAVVATFEGDDKRKFTLDDAPVFGMQTRYLEELACGLNARGTTNLSCHEALSAIGTAAAHMVEERLLGAVPQPASVLDVLASHHVLHVQDGFVRFAHQRFQEYFGAARLLRTDAQADDSIRRLGDAVNEPAWGDSLELVAGTLKAPCGSGAARARLVQAAEALDLAYACELAGLCAFAESDDAALHARLVSRVNEFGASPLGQVRDLSVACKIASRLPAFAENLWALFESDEQQTRLHSHRLIESRVSLTQLGSQAEARINAWPPARRSEFMHEIADNSDNYDFIVRAAVSDPDPDVRAAAISALFWSYPASTAGINAWLNAPLDVQTKHDLVGYVDYELEQGVAGDQIREQLRVIGASEISHTARLQLALAFPVEVGPTAVHVVLTRLRSEEQRGSSEQLISIAEAQAPDRLRALALELVAGRGTPQWAGELLLRETPEMRELAFETAWKALMAGDVRRLSSELVGPLSSMAQTRRSVAVWLRHCAERRSNLSDAEQERGREVGYLLAHAPGDDLLGVVMELEGQASYQESVELAEMLLTRVSRGEGYVSGANPWLPKLEQFAQLFELFSRKREEAQNPQDRLFTQLACIASYVAPAEFGPLLLEALRRHLDTWTAYRALLDEWLRRPSSPRPHNPSLGNYVISALTRWGMDALPGVLQLLSHPNASDLVPQAIGCIASLPWTSTKKQTFSSVNTDVQDGRQRRDVGRVLQQPSPAYQPVTDDAARALAGLLNLEVDRQLAERKADPKWNARQGEYQVSNLVGILANLPSAVIVAPVTRALASGLLGLYGFVGAVRALTRQGWVFSDAAVVGEFEALYARETSPDWVDESTRYTLAEFSQLMFLVDPPTHLKLPLSHFLSQWQRFAHPSEVIRVLGDMRTERAWPLLLALGTELSTMGETPDELPYALASALSSNHFAAFARLVGDGTLFSWCSNALTLERIAPAVADVVKNAPEHLASLIDSWRKCASPLADALLAEVLTALDAGDEKRWGLGLEALDAGRANDPNMPAYRMLKRMFKLQVPLGDNQFEVYPKACNPLRLALYRRAKAGGDAGRAARRLLASLECGRREGERPADEPRHPDPGDGLPWTSVLSLSDTSTS